MSEAPGGTIASVEPGSPAASAGLSPGDRIVAANGRPLADVIDWRWESSEAEVLVSVEGADGSRRDMTLRRSEGGWGLHFAEQLFDGVRECANSCVFCFVAQLPPGLRPTLYVRDDDFRLSFLHGNFVTLTNVTAADVDRILEQALSPLYVSLHAVTPKVRRRLMCPTEADDALGTLEELMRGGIDVHLQIVLVPGLNDAEELDETLSWAARHERVLSVGVVPMGFTAHQTRFRSSYPDPASASAVLERVRQWQAVMRVERRQTWVQAADELYLAARRPLPAWDEYDGFPQYDNGVGLARAFVDEVKSAIAERRERGGPEPVSPSRHAVLLTGELFAPVLMRLASALATIGVDSEVLPVHNALFGGNVSVTGLLSRADIAEAIRGHGGEGPYLVPDAVVNSDGLFLDDLSYQGEPGETLSRQTGRDVRVVPSEGRPWIDTVTRILAHQED